MFLTYPSVLFFVSTPQQNIVKLCSYECILCRYTHSQENFLGVVPLLSLDKYTTETVYLKTPLKLLNRISEKLYDKHVHIHRKLLFYLRKHKFDQNILFCATCVKLI